MGACAGLVARAAARFSASTDLSEWLPSRGRMNPQWMLGLERRLPVLERSCDAGPSTTLEVDHPCRHARAVVGLVSTGDPFVELRERERERPGFDDRRCGAPGFVLERDVAVRHGAGVGHF